MYEEDGCSRVPAAPSCETKNLMDNAVFLAIALASLVLGSSGSNPSGCGPERNRVFQLLPVLVKRSSKFPQPQYPHVVGESYSAICNVMRMIHWYPQAFNGFAQVRLACKAR